MKHLIYIYLLLLVMLSACSTTTKHWKYVSPNTDSRSVASLVCGRDWSPEVLTEEIMRNNIKAIEIECTLK